MLIEKRGLCVVPLRSERLGEASVFPMVPFGQA